VEIIIAANIRPNKKPRIGGRCGVLVFTRPETSESHAVPAPAVLVDYQAQQRYDRQQRHECDRRGALEVLAGAGVDVHEVLRVVQ
jgi:hypothetical protein